MKMLHNPDSRADFERRLAALNPKSQRRWGTMSVDQMLWHVNATFLLHLGEIKALRKKNPLPRSVMKFLVLNFPWPKSLPILAPLVAKHRYKFCNERQRCLQLINRFATKRLDEVWPENPVFGKVSGTFVSR